MDVPRVDQLEVGQGPKQGGPLNVKDLGSVSRIRPLAEILFTWVVIAAAVAAYLRHPAPGTFAAVFALVASRQYALLILLHDAFHTLVHPNRRINDFLGTILIGAPCGSAYWSSRAAHLEHHRKLGKDGDPEFFLHCVGPPSDKRSWVAFIRHFALLVSGRQVFYSHFGAAEMRGSAGRQWWKVLPQVVRVATAQLALLGVFALAGSWATYFTLWVLPLLTLTVLFNGLRAFCDHANLSDEAGDKAHRLTSYVSNVVERFFLAPFHMNYHAEHHLFPYVPHYNLPELRRKIMLSPEHRAMIDWRSGYLAFVREFLRAQRVLRSPASGNQ